MQNAYRHIIHPRFVIAELLGAQLEAYFQVFSSGKPHKDDGWLPIYDLLSVRKETKVRVRAGGEGILEQADAFVSANFYEMTYEQDGYVVTYLVPNSARQVGYVHIGFGFGVITDPEGRFVARQHLMLAVGTEPIQPPSEHTRYSEIVTAGKCVNSHELSVKSP